MRLVNYELNILRFRVQQALTWTWWPRHERDNIGPHLRTEVRWMKGPWNSMSVDIWLRWWPYWSIKPGNILIEIPLIRFGVGWKTSPASEITEPAPRAQDGGAIGSKEAG